MLYNKDEVGKFLQQCLSCKNLPKKNFLALARLRGGANMAKKKKVVKRKKVAKKKKKGGKKRR